MQDKRQAAGTEAAPEAVRTLLAGLGKAGRAELLDLWVALHGTPPPRAISQTLLRQILAFDLQLQAAGGWPSGLKARLARAAEARGRPATAPPVAGGRLLRTWNGTTHSVEVTPDGYLWQGRTWRSLSAIAREITGAHWSGPRFFGLTAPRRQQRKPRPSTTGKQAPPDTASDADAGRAARAGGQST